MEQVTIGTLNVAATSKERARRILDEWIRPAALDVYVLTETSEGPGTTLILSELKAAGWAVFQRSTVPPSQRPLFLRQEQFEYEWYRQLLGTCGLYDTAIKHHPGGHESTWVAHTGEGYTYDHILADQKLSARIMSFSYDHSSRARGGVTDHSAVIISIEVDSVSWLDLEKRGMPTKQTTLF